jgi:flagellar basal-body rod protein FlgC
MSLMRAMDITASGLFASRTRMNIAASNLANANSTRTADGGGAYRRKNVVLAARKIENFNMLMQDRIKASLRNVEVVGVQNDPRPPKSVYDPGHPDADAKGIVKMPNVNMIEEMVDMITASRAYEAGTATMQSIKSMADKALTIGK